LRGCRLDKQWVRWCRLLDWARWCSGARACVRWSQSLAASACAAESGQRSAHGAPEEAGRACDGTWVDVRRSPLWSVA